MMLRCLTFIFIILNSASALAREMVEFPRPTSALGMGGVYLPFVKETDAVLWNPAALNEIEQLSWEVVDAGVGANGADILELVEEMNSSGCSGTACLGDFYGKPVHMNIRGKTAFSAPKWGLTYFTGWQLEGTLHNPAFPSFNMTFLSDYGVATGFGFLVAENLSGGIAIKRTSRWGGTQDISLSTITSGGSSFMDDFNQRGTAFGLDFGLLYRAPAVGPFKSTAAIHWRDVGSTAFIPQGDLQAPPRIKDNLSAAWGGEMDLIGLDARVGLEYRHILDTTEPLAKKLHVGAEVSLPMLDIRAGLNQGYPTIGAGLDFFLFRMDASSYTEEVGAYPGQTPSNRFQASLSMEFSVDANFKFTSKDGKARRLKQRR